MFQDIAIEIEAIRKALQATIHDQVTEEKYRLDERKRKVLGNLDKLTKARDLHIEINRYQLSKDLYIERQQEATIVQQGEADRIFSREQEMLGSGDKHLVKRTTEELDKLNNRIFFQHDENYVALFFHFCTMPDDYYQPETNKEELITIGRDLIDKRDFMQLKQIVVVMFNKLKEEHKRSGAISPSVLGGNNSFRTGLK